MSRKFGNLHKAMKTDFNLDPAAEQPSEAEPSAEARGLALIHVPRERNGRRPSPHPFRSTYGRSPGAETTMVVVAPGRFARAALGCAGGWFRWKTTYIASV
jgi:hypothetical protein